MTCQSIMWRNILDCFGKYKFIFFQWVMGSLLGSLLISSRLFEILYPLSDIHLRILIDQCSHIFNPSFSDQYALLFPFTKSSHMSFMIVHLHFNTRPVRNRAITDQAICRYPPRIKKATIKLKMGIINAGIKAALIHDEDNFLKPKIPFCLLWNLSNSITNNLITFLKFNIMICK